MRHARSVLSGVLTAVAAVAAVVLVPSAALAATRPSGIDVSYPQCSDDGTGSGIVALPQPGAFAVVGVNTGLATGTNPCLAAELAWAGTAPGGAGVPAVALYVNTANPGLDAAWWPASNRLQHGGTVHNPRGTCRHRAGAACAYVYGYSLAHDDATRRGVPDAASSTWWLDVETANSWSSDRAANRAALEGMVAGFRAARATAGLYATRQHWVEVAGAVPGSSTLAALPGWLAGATTRSGAAANCSHAPLPAAGRIRMTQYTVTGGLDRDLACLRIAKAPRPTASGTARIGSRLTAKPGSWSAGVHLAYQWRRGSAAIAGATGRSYLLHRADAGHSIAVRVTGTRSGYDREVRTSGARHPR